MAKISGFREASKALNDMSKAMARGVGRRALKVPATILADEMRQKVPVLSGTTRESIEVGKQASFKGRPATNVTVADIASVQLEFGNSDMEAQPFARPALEAASGRMLEGFGSALKDETDKAVIRQAAREARRQAGGR